MTCALSYLAMGIHPCLLNPKHGALTWERIIRENLVCYMSLGSMKDSYVSTNVGKLLKQDLVYYMGDRYTLQREFKAVNLTTDELYSCFYRGDVDILNKLRAAGLRATVGLQTTADIEALISEAVRKQVYGLISNKIYLRIPDGEQAKELTETMGQCLVPKATLTRNVGGSITGQDIAEGELFRSGYAQRLDLTETDLLPQEIITSLPLGQAVLVTKGQPPVILRVPLLDRAGLPKVSFFDHITKLYEGKKIALDTDTEI